jgi:hypothetical protein
VTNIAMKMSLWEEMNNIKTAKSEYEGNELEDEHKSEYFITVNRIHPGT